MYSTFLAEIAGLSVLWVFWIAGAAGATVRLSFPPPFPSSLPLPPSPSTAPSPSAPPDPSPSHTTPEKRTNASLSPQHPWGALGFCQQFNACRVLSALVAFAWLGWLTLTLLLAFSLLFSIANKASREPLHGRWNPRASGFGGASVVRA